MEYRKIPSLKFLYEISEDGRHVRNVKSKKHLKIILNMHHTPTGYYCFYTHIKLHGVRKVRCHPVHKIVAECWLGPRLPGWEVDHIDRNTHNNHWLNLRYVTHSEQMKNRVLGEHVIQAGKKNLMEYVFESSVATLLQNKTEVHYFTSMKAAARFLAEECGCTVEQARSRLKARRQHILGYDVKYGRGKRL